MGVKNRLAEHGIQAKTELFEWSGKNTHPERIFWSERLTDKLIEYGKNQRTFIVAHSHGGTIADMAISNTERDFWPEGVITFGTPFIYVYPRKYQNFIRMAKFSVISLIVLFFMYCFSYASATFRFMPNIYILSFVVITGIFSSILFYLKVMNWLRSWLGRSSECANVLFERDRENSLPFICYTSIFDIAHIGLNTWSGATSILRWIPYLLLIILLSAIPSLFFSAQYLIFGGSDVASALIAIRDYLQPFIPSFVISDTNYDMEIVSRYIILAFFLGSMSFSISMIIVIILSIPFSVAFSWLLRNHKYGYGDEGPLWHVTHDIGIRKRPNKQSLQIRTFYPKAYLHREWMHNYFPYHQDMPASVAQHIVEWPGSLLNPGEKSLGILYWTLLQALMALCGIILGVVIMSDIIIRTSAFLGAWFGWMLEWRYQ
jgi:hypothetical protein